MAKNYLIKAKEGGDDEATKILSRIDKETHKEE